MPAIRRRRMPALVLLLAVLTATAVTTVPASAGAGCHRPATEGRGTTLALAELCFSPTVLRVPAGRELTVVNRDTIEHPLGRPGGQWSWGGAVGDRTTLRLGPGTHPFFCYTHPGMVGVVVVGDGQGTGAAVVEAAGGPGAGRGLAAADDPAPAAADPGAVPTAWLVLVALCALVGAAAGTRLAAGRSGR